MEHKGFHLQHRLQEEYAWNSSNLYNGYSSSSQSTGINLRDHQGYGYGFNPQGSPSDGVVVARIKDEGSHNYLPRLSAMISSLSSSCKRPVDGGIALSNKAYNTFGAACSSSSFNLSSNLEMPPRSLGLSSQMLLGGSSCGVQLSYDSFGLDEDSMCLNQSIMQQRENSPSNSSNKISGFISGVARTKMKKKYEAKAKKSRPSCSPLKVRKEKLGDRIQTLQTLVAPFGKTNTASVLAEAIGYIHFLHDQIQTLSIPYMRSSKTKPFQMVQLDSKEEDSRTGEWKADLRSRGLRLVPLSYASYIHNLE